MTVAELILELQRLDPNANIMLPDFDSDLREIHIRHVDHSRVASSAGISPTVHYILTWWRPEEDDC